MAEISEQGDPFAPNGMSKAFWKLVKRRADQMD